MSGVTLVTRQVDRTIDIDRQIDIHLNQAAVISLIPVVTAPRLSSDVLDLERFPLRQRRMFHGPLAASPNGCLKHGIEFVRRNDELPPVRLVALDGGPCSWKQFVESI